MFVLTAGDLPSPDALLGGPARDCGGFACFEGRVRDHDRGRAVTGLHYEAYEEMARDEGERILAEAAARFGTARLGAAHRHGSLRVGDTAVLVVAAAPHRDEAFAACRWIIDRIKERLPVWKREHYADGSSEWVGCGCVGGGQSDTPSSAGGDGGGPG